MHLLKDLKSVLRLCQHIGNVFLKVAIEHSTYCGILRFDTNHALHAMQATAEFIMWHTHHQQSGAPLTFHIR